jgi:hypothetical protein
MTSSLFGMSHLFSEFLILMLSYLLSSFFYNTSHSISSQYEIQWFRPFVSIKPNELYQKELDYSSLSAKNFSIVLFSFDHTPSVIRHPIFLSN